MNLSFVCYDNEQKDLFYKEHEDVNDTIDREESESTAKALHVSNGFLRKKSPDSAIAAKVEPVIEANTQRDKSQYKHLISERDFNDVLQACRPRSRGEHGSGLPKSLTCLIQKFTPHYNAPSSPGRNIAICSDGVETMSPQRVQNSSRNHLGEWGAVSFDNFATKKGIERGHGYQQYYSGSHSSPSSSFASVGSHLLSFQHFGLSHLQASLSLTGGGQSLSSGGGGDTHVAIHKLRHSDSMASEETTDMPTDCQDISDIERIMFEHDENTFSLLPKPQQSTPASMAIPQKPEESGMMRSHSYMLSSFNKGSGGIEAALAAHVEPVSGARQPSGVSENVVIPLPEETVSRPMAVSPLSFGMMPYSLDRRREGLRPNGLRVAPEAITRSALRDFQPLGDRRKSFSVLNQLQSSETGASIPMKSQHHQKSSSSLPRSVSKKPPSRRTHSHHHHSHRHRRKQWVLNPFRQEDEDEVLAKRTHNRRRWSHVFPIGEAEFKRLVYLLVLVATSNFHGSLTFSLLLNPEGMLVLTGSRCANLRYYPSPLTFIHRHESFRI